MNSISLTPHPLRYSLNTAEFLFCCVTATAIPYALRHFEQARSSEPTAWKHYFIGVIECFPVLGLIVAVIERILYTNIHSHRLATLGRQLIDISSRSHFTFQAPDCVTQFKQLPPCEQTRLQESVTDLMHSSPQKIEKPQLYSDTHDLMKIWDYLTEKTTLEATPTPEQFIQVLQEITPQGVPWHQTSYFGGSALHWAVRSKRIDVIKYLLNTPEGRAMLNLADNYIVETPLMTATSTKFISSDANREEIVSLLLDAQANPNLISDEGFTPLHVAAERGDLSLIQILLQHRAATINPAIPLSDNASTALYYSYYLIDKALKEGLDSVIAHRDVHRHVIDYYFGRDLLYIHS
jgi:hypothetical protein